MYVLLCVVAVLCNTIANVAADRDVYVGLGFKCKGSCWQSCGAASYCQWCSVHELRVACGFLDWGTRERMLPAHWTGYRLQHAGLGSWIAAFQSTWETTAASRREPAALFRHPASCCARSPSTAAALRPRTMALSAVGDNNGMLSREQSRT